MPNRTRLQSTVAVLAGCAAMFVVLQFVPGWLMQWLDLSTSMIIATVAMLGLALVLERRLFARPPAHAMAALGWRSPSAGAVVVAGVLSLLMLASFPIFTAITGAPVRLRADWLWILAGAVALNGIGEETLFRGYVFGGLRRSGYGFAPAASISMAVFAAVHLFLFIGNPFIIGVLGTLVAIAAAFPLAYLYERGHNSVWPPAMVHVATHTIRFVEVPEAYSMTATTSWLALQLVMPFLVFLLGWKLLSPAGIRTD